MIRFICSSCGKALEVADDLGGCDYTCTGCGAATVVPLDMACEEDIQAAPDAETITLEELEALRRALRNDPPK